MVDRLYTFNKTKFSCGLKTKYNTILILNNSNKELKDMKLPSLSKSVSKRNFSCEKLPGKLSMENFNDFLSGIDKINKYQETKKMFGQK